jgi:hypothetical protein
MNAGSVLVWRGSPAHIYCTGRWGMIFSGAGLVVGGPSMDMQGSRCQMQAMGSDRAEGVLFCNREPVLALEQRCYWSACGSLLGQAGKVQTLKARFNHVSRSSAVSAKRCIYGVCSLSQNEFPVPGWLACEHGPFFHHVTIRSESSCCF